VMLPTSLIVVAIVIGWLVVLVPLVVRRRHAIARTADSALAARVVRSGRDVADEEVAVGDAEDEDSEAPAEDLIEDDNPGPRVDTTVPDDDGDHVAIDDVQRGAPPGWEQHVDDMPRRYRPGRGGYDPDAAALAARAKYTFRQRIVVLLLILAIASAVAGGFVMAVLWWAHGAVDVGLFCYLAYLRRQVRIEAEIRQRRLARMAQARRAQARSAPPPRQRYVDEQPRARERYVEAEPVRERERHEPVAARPSVARTNIPGAVVVEVDDEDPVFDELQQPGSLPYRQAAGE
jgi:hypothetical protein